MTLAEVYEKIFATKEAAAEKKAEGEEAAAAQAAGNEAEAAGEKQETQLADADIDAALGQMSDEELQALAKDVATGMKEKESAAQAEVEKQAEDLFAAGRIFAQGFIQEVSGQNGSTKTSSEPKKGVEKFAALLEKELQGQKK